MIQLKEIRNKAEKQYKTLLQNIALKKTFTRIDIQFNKTVSSNFSVFCKELDEIKDNSKAIKGYGYEVSYKTLTKRNFGEQSIPDEIYFPTEPDYLKFIGKAKEVAAFRKDAALLLANFPELEDWITKYPMKIIENNGIWSDIANVCAYFKETPRPNLYIRELPINVHTKFIEQNKGIVREMLDVIIKDSVNADEKDFEKRFNLKYEEPAVRFRILDKELAERSFNSITELSVPISQFVPMRMPVSKIFIVENKMNMLTFPNVGNSIVIWGKGFGVDIMKQVKWLADKEIYYWGDLDAQGFEILSNARTHFHQVVSFLMDRTTYDKFKDGNTGTPSNITTTLRLTKEEYDIYNYLKENNLRLEQEKIPQYYVIETINKLISTLALPS